MSATRRPALSSGVLATLATVVTLGLTVSACGTDGDDASPQAAPTALDPASEAASTDPVATTEPAPTEDAAEEPPAGAPQCSEVWQVGATLPRSYAGCVEEGRYVERDVLGCSSGQRLARFDETYYGVLGGEVRKASVTPLVDDADYRRSIRSCRA